MRSIYSLSAGALLVFASIRPAAAAETLFKNGTVLTVTKGSLERGDLLIRDGKIAAIGRNIKPGAGARVIDATGKFLMPGVIDAHSHLCIEGGINETTEVVSAEVDVMEVVNEKDPGVKWALAGGVTTINTMHGSANPIGGLTATLKLRWGKSADEMKFAGARRHIKFALGENPKRVHFERGVTSRLGVAETIKQQFTAAREYQRDWDDYRKKLQSGQQAIPPRKNLRLESMAGVLRGDIWVQCHCYRADEIEMLLKLSDEFGFKVGALQHVLEGYKVAPEIAARNIGASTFADFWGYKVEAYDGIVYNPAALMQWGVRASVNSDSGERIRRLNLDGAKSLRYGGLTDDQCLALVTLNPAWQLGIDSKVGSLEVGKDADLSVWDAHPLSPYSKCVMTLVDGDVYFERKTDGSAAFGLAAADNDPAKAVSANTASAPKQPVTPFTPLNVPVSAKPSEPADFAITGARIVTVSGPTIENGTVVVRNGRIEAVGADVAVPGGMKVVHANGLSLYPGFINATGNLGLTEVSSVPESQDLGESGSMRPQIRASDAFHTQSAWVGLARCAGVTSALTSPRGSGWSGWSSLMHTAGRTVEQSTVASELGQTLNLSGAAAPSGGGGEGGITPTAPPSTGDQDSSRTSSQKALADAKAYARSWDEYKTKNEKGARPPKSDLTLAALAPVARGDRPVFVAASSRDDVLSAVRFGRENRVSVVVTGGRDADRASSDLVKAGVPVIFSELYGMPIGQDAYDKNFAASRRLFEQGVKFCIASNEPVNLAQIAGTAAAYGLPREEALKAITLYPAQILGVEKELGSIEVGKIADFLLTDGDPLEYKTHIRKMFVNGVETPLVSRHSQLYEEYRKRK